MKSFEERLEELEQVGERIREGKISLDEAVKEFERGIKLAKSLEKDLARIERRVEVLVNEPDEPGEKPVLELFPELSEATGTQPENDQQTTEE